LNRFLAPLILLALVLFAACGGGASSQPPSPSASRPPADAVSNDGRQESEPMPTVELVERLRPSVVHIQADSSVGTGFIIDEEGTIVTNNHVVAGASRIEVTLSDGRTFDVRDVAVDPPTDLAVLDIDANNLKAAPLGRSEDLRVGEDVIAIGHALNLPGGPTVTKGVVSALNRTIEEGGISIPDAIQTDASINPGNSGGPLVNSRGEVVGITTAVIRGTAEGIGLAISIDSARPIIDELARNGSVDRGRLGVRIAPLDAFSAVTCDVQVQSGVLIGAVEPGSPADKAGLRACDVITRVADIKINNTGDLFRALTENRAGETVEVEYNRQGDERTTEVTLG
jgi:S1-C subfamily serine protease